MNIIIDSHRMRRAIRMGAAILLSLSANYFFSFSHQGWLVFTAVAVMLTQTGNAFYQGILRFVWVAILIVVISGLIFSFNGLYEWLQAAVLGAIIGILCNMFILPDRLVIDFQRAMVPIIQSYETYLSAIIALLLRNHHEMADDAKISVERALQHLPLWAFARGFDRRLQKGHRYFVMQTEQIAEILFAMHHLARYQFDQTLLVKIRKPLLQCVKKANVLFFAISQVLMLKKLTSGVEDFSFEIKKIEKAFKKRVRLTAEWDLMEKSPVYLAEFIFELNELHDLLLSLASTLR